MEPTEQYPFLSLPLQSGIPWKMPSNPPSKWEGRVALVLKAWGIDETFLPSDCNDKQDETYVYLVKLADLLRSWIGKYPVYRRLGLLRRGLEGRVSLDILENEGTQCNLHTYLESIASKS